MSDSYSNSNKQTLTQHTPIKEEMIEEDEEDYANDDADFDVDDLLQSNV